MEDWMPTSTRARSAKHQVNLEEFRQAVLELGLILPDEIDHFFGDGLIDAPRLARELVRDGKLTSYQANALIQGKGKGLVIGDYLILDKLGKGGMGVVFKARSRRSMRPVALKVLLPSFGRDLEAVERFRREFEVAARLDHPHIVSALEAGADRGVQFLTMVYVDGHNLDDLVTSVCPLPLKMTLQCLIHAAMGLAAAHGGGIVHRDVKPGNLMLDASGNVRVLDLGLARLVEASGLGTSSSGSRAKNLTQTGAYLGTVDYVAPEQANDSKQADHRADIYSLGCTLHFLLTGRPPFEDDSPLERLMAHQLRPAPTLFATRDDIPPKLESTYQAMMAKKPRDRPGSMAEVVRLLEDCRSSPNEATAVMEGMRGFAVTVMKRASPRKRGWSIDASVFARREERDADPDQWAVCLEDVLLDFREEIHAKPLAQEQLPPKHPRSRHSSPRRDRPRRPQVALAFCAIGLFMAAGAIAKWALDRKESPGPIAPRITLTAPPSNTVDQERKEALVPVKRNGLGESRREGSPPDPTPESADPSSYLAGVARPLFNGKNTSGWVLENCTPDDWQVRDEILTTQGKRRATAGRLVTERAFGDFSLHLEYQSSGGSDSGVLVVDRKDREKDRHFAEFNIGDSLDPKGGTGDFHAYEFEKTPSGKAARSVSFKGAGAWEVMEIERRGELLRLTINGRTVHDWVLHQGGPAYIGPQTYRGMVRFRNIRIREWSPAGEDQESSSEIAARTLYVDDFDDPRSGWPQDTVGKYPHFYRDGYYVIPVPARFTSGWKCPFRPGASLECEITGRIVHASPTSQGAISLHMINGDFGVEVRLNSRAQLFFKPSFLKSATEARLGLLGPYTHPSFATGGTDFNRFLVRLEGRRLEVFACGERVAGPVMLEWDTDPVRLELGASGASGNVEAVFDRIEIRRPTLSPAARALWVRAEALRRQGQPDLAEKAYRSFLESNPDDLDVRKTLVSLLEHGPDSGLAAREWRELLRLSRDDGPGHAALSAFLLESARVDEALATARQAVELRKGLQPKHLEYQALASALLAKDDSDGAVRAFRDAVRLNGRSVDESNFQLADLLRRLGRYEESTEVLSQVRQIAKAIENKNLYKRAEDAMKDTLAWRSLSQRLSGFVSGAEVPKNFELDALAWIFTKRRLYASGARAFERAPKQASSDGYQEACLAAMAGTRPGDDSPPPDNKSKIRFRAQALAKLRASLDQHRKNLERRKPANASNTLKSLSPWRIAPRLEEVRSPDWLKKLPESESKEWRTLWDEVDELIASARSQLL